MILPSIQSAAVAFVVGAALSVPLTWYLTAEYKDAKHSAIISAQEKEAAEVLRGATIKILEAERKIGGLKDELEIEHAKSIKQADALLADNRRLAAKLGGLRDPGRTDSGCGPMPAATGATADNQGGSTGSEFSNTTEGFLSAEAGEFLLNFAAEADRAAIYAQTCHEWAMKQPTILEE